MRQFSPGADEHWGHRKERKKEKESAAAPTETLTLARGAPRRRPVPPGEVCLLSYVVLARTSSSLNPNCLVSLAVKPLYWAKPKFCCLNFMGKDVCVSACFLDELHHEPKVQIGGNSVKTNRIVSDLQDFRGESALLAIEYRERDPFTTTE